MNELTKLEKLFLSGSEASKKAQNESIGVMIQSSQPDEGKTDGMLPFVRCNEGKRLSGAQKRKLKKGRVKNQEDGVEPQNQLTAKNKVSYELTNGRQNLSRKDALQKQAAAVVVPVGFPSVKLTKPQTDLVRNSIAQAIDAGADGYRPQFLECVKMNGALMIVCNNQSSLDWLKIAITNMTLEDLHLSIIDPQDLPVYTKLILWVPGLEDPTRILEKLKIQNEGLETKEWHIINTKFERDGQTLVVSVDENTMEILRKIDFRPFFNLGRVKLSNLKKLKVEQNENHLNAADVVQ